jgi:hypothetical protein
MKRVTNWFNLGLLIGFIWLILDLSLLGVTLFGGEQANEIVAVLWLKLLSMLLNLLTKFLLLGAGIFYLFHVTQIWQREQEEEKQKFEFEKTKKV